MDLNHFYNFKKNINKANKLSWLKSWKTILPSCALQFEPAQTIKPDSESFSEEV